MVLDGVVTARGSPTRTATLTVIDSRAPRFNQAVIGVVVVARRRDRLVVAARAARAPARARADARPALVPAVPRLLRARPAALRRGAARGLAPAARREHRRPRRPRAPPRSPTRSALHGPRRRARPARRGARAARRRHRLLHRLRGLQARSAALTGKPFVSCPLPEAQLRGQLPSMTWQFSLAGLLVGILVGMTGMGGGIADDADPDPASSASTRRSRSAPTSSTARSSSRSARPATGCSGPCTRGSRSGCSPARRRSSLVGVQVANSIDSNMDALQRRRRDRADRRRARVPR